MSVLRDFAVQQGIIAEGCPTWTKDWIPGSQTHTPLSTFTAGDIVRYKPEFLNRLNGQVDVIDVCGEVVSTTRLVAVVRWGNNTESRVLIGNLEIAKGPQQTSWEQYGLPYQNERAERNAELIIKWAADFAEIWKSTEPGKLAGNADERSR